MKAERLGLTLLQLFNSTPASGSAQAAAAAAQRSSCSSSMTDWDLGSVSAAEAGGCCLLLQSLDNKSSAPARHDCVTASICKAVPTLLLLLLCSKRSCAWRSKRTKM